MTLTPVVRIMIITVVVGFSMPVTAAALPQGGPPAGADPVKCAGCVGTTDIADGAVTAIKVADGAIGSTKVDPAQVQRRVAGSCTVGSSISAINQDGTVVCATVQAGVSAVTASAPLVSSGGSSPNLSLPGVIIDTVFNTAVGNFALSNNTTGSYNTAGGFGALANNTTGIFNTASGVQALLSNTEGSYNTAGGLGALANNTTGNSNTASGWQALLLNTTGGSNTASGVTALVNNSEGGFNTAIGLGALGLNTTGNFNTAVGWTADVASGNLSNATAIGAGAVVDDSDKIRLGNSSVSVIEAQVGLTVVSDATKKENFQPVNGEAVLRKIHGLSLSSWNLIGQDPKRFRHYGPMAQEFFAAFGSDDVGTIGNPTTITSTDMDGILMVGVQALEKRTAEQTAEVSRLKTENATLKARLETLETLMREVLPQR